MLDSHSREKGKSFVDDKTVSCKTTFSMVGGGKLRRCYVCEKEVEMMGTVKEHMEKKHTAKQFKFSNSLADVCKTACKLCGKVMTLQRMRTHTKEKHGMGITDYKSNFNQNFFDLEEKVFHACGICKEPVLLDMDILVGHLNNSKASHGGISQSEYKAKFLLKTKSQRKKEPAKDFLLPNEADVKTFIGALSDVDTAALVEDLVEKEEEEHCLKFEACLPQFRTFIKSLNEKTQGRGKPMNQREGFPALEKLLLMDVSTEESILKGVEQFSTTTLSQN